MSFLRKLSPTAITKRLPKSVRKVVAKTPFLNPGLRLGQAMDEATQSKFGGAGGIHWNMKGGRAALRRFHMSTFRPYSAQGKDVRAFDAAVYTGNANERRVAFGRLKQLNASTEKHGIVAAKIGSLFIGGYAGAAIKTGVNVAARASAAGMQVNSPADTLPYPSSDPMSDSYRRYGINQPAYRAGGQKKGGLLTLLWTLLVPKK